MNYDDVENLSVENILELYDDTVVNGSINNSLTLTQYNGLDILQSVYCDNGQYGSMWVWAGGETNCYIVPNKVNYCQTSFAAQYQANNGGHIVFSRCGGAGHSGTVCVDACIINNKWL